MAKCDSFSHEMKLKWPLIVDEQLILHNNAMKIQNEVLHSTVVEALMYYFCAVKFWLIKMFCHVCTVPWRECANFNELVVS
jgi:hypothetical protein